MCNRIYTQHEQTVIRNFKNSHGNECYYCHGKIYHKDEITVDHKLPFSRGGLTIDSNLEICCEKCNKEKSDMTQEEYISYLQVKENLIKNNNTLNELENMINSTDAIIIRFGQCNKLLSDKVKEKVEIEKCITDIKFNASEGYMLCRDMKKILIEITNLQKESSRLNRLQAMVKKQKLEFKTAYDTLKNELIMDLRKGMDIGRLGLKESA